MAKEVEWNKYVYDRFCELAMLSDFEKQVLESRIKGYSINREEAEKIVRAMKPYGEFWSYEQIKDYLKERDIDDCLDYYLAMNMVRNDYYDTAKKYMLQDDTEFYFSLAQDFLVDEDAKPFKVAKYFK